MLNDQNERIIADYQSKLLVAERQRQSADVRASTLDSSRESNRSEVTQLRMDLGALRQTYISLEHEKDTLLVTSFNNIFSRDINNIVICFTSINWIPKLSGYTNWSMS